VDSKSVLCYELQLEEAFQKQQQDELTARQAEKERVERERIEARKRREVQRITEV
jgi:spectrin beta